MIRAAARVSRARLAALALLLALAAAPPARAQPADADTLRLSVDGALERALQLGEEMRLARAFVEQTEGRVREALSRAFPQVSGSLTYDRKLESIFAGAETDTTGIGDLLEQSPFAARNAWTGEVYAEQLLWSGGKVGAALRAAKAANREARAAVRESAADVAYQVRRAYFGALYARALVDIAADGLALAREHLRQVRAGRREGARSEFDLLRAEVDAANQEPVLVEARRGAEVALLLLRALVNVPPSQPLALTTPLGFADGLVPVVVAETLSVAGRPALAAAEAEVEARRNAVQVYRGQRWPDLYLSSTFQQQAFPREVFPGFDEFRRNWNVSVRLALPLFTGFRVEGQVQQARADLATARASLDRLRESAAIEAEEASGELERSLSLLLARRRAVEQARRAHELAGVRYANGMSTQVEVSDARLQYQAAEVHEVSAARDYLVALARLERAVGGPPPVTRMTLEEAAGTLDPEGRR